MQTANSLLSPPIQDNAPTPRLLFVATSQNDGGIERHSVRMAAALRRRGVPLTFACCAGEIIDRRCGEAGIPTHPFHPRNSGDLRAARRLFDLIAAERVDLVHVHSRRDYVPAVVAVAAARRRTSEPYAPRLILHAHMLRALGEPALLSGRLFARGSHAVVAVSDAVRSHLLREHALPPAFVRVIHNGIEVDGFDQKASPQTDEKRRAWHSAWGLPAGALVIGMVGRLDAKGQASLLHAVPLLLSRFPTLRIVFVGAEGAPGETQRLQAIGARHNFADRLIFTGPREDVPDILAAFDILAHLPQDESFGLALVEGMAAGLPTVATDIGGCREVVRQDLTGLLVTPDGPAALTAALSALLSDPRQRRRLGATGRQIALSEFSLSSQIDRLQTLYEELCPRPRLILR